MSLSSCISISVCDQCHSNSVMHEGGGGGGTLFFCPRVDELTTSRKRPTKLRVFLVSAAVSRATADGVEVELADGDAHAPRAQVAQAEDTPAVGEDDAVAERVAVGVLLQLGGRVPLGMAAVGSQRLMG